MSINQPKQNKIQILKALIEATGDDFNTYLCYLGELATKQRQAEAPESLIDLNIDTTIKNKIADLIDYLQPIAA